MNNENPEKTRSPRVTSIENAGHYIWGDNCEGWYLLQSKKLSVIQEKIPFGKREQLHLHVNSQQVFYILSGIATFEIQGHITIVHAMESVHIPPGTQHFIANLHQDDLIFLVISEPESHNDRQNII